MERKDPPPILPPLRAAWASRGDASITAAMARPAMGALHHRPPRVVSVSAGAPERPSSDDAQTRVQTVEGGAPERTPATATPDDKRTTDGFFTKVQCNARADDDDSTTVPRVVRGRPALGPRDDGAARTRDEGASETDMGPIRRLRIAAGAADDPRAAGGAEELRGRGQQSCGRIWKGGVAPLATWCGRVRRRVMCHAASSSSQQVTRTGGSAGEDLGSFLRVSTL